MGRQSRKAE